jgi:hypothetical protein
MGVGGIGVTVGIGVGVSKIAAFIEAVGIAVT